MVRKIGVLTIMLLIIGLVINSGDAQATLIDIGIQNAGFEKPEIGNGNFNSAIPDDWGIYSENNDSYWYGVWNPRARAYPEHPGGAPEGSNVGYIDIANEGTGIVGFEQTISKNTLMAALTPSTTYWLLVDVGNTGWFSGFPDYRIELLAGNTVLASDENTLSPEERHFLTSEVSFTAPVSGDLTIRLLNLSTGAGREVNFDNVRVSDTPIATPEPATMLLLGAGLIGLAGFGRKKLFRK